MQPNNTVQIKKLSELLKKNSLQKNKKHNNRTKIETNESFLSLYLRSAALGSQCVCTHINN